MLTLTHVNQFYGGSHILWDLDLTVYPTRASYAQWAPHRHIPVMVLEPVTESPPGD